MRVLKIALFLFLSLGIVFASQKEIQINFKSLSSENFVKIVSKAIQKDILITSSIEGEVNFSSNTPITKKNILDILQYDLISKGFTLLEKNGIYLIVKNDNLSLYTQEKKQSLGIEVVTIKNLEASLVANILKEVTTSQTLGDFQNTLVSLDTENNRIVLMGRQKDIDLLVSLIQKLDLDQQQVYVEAKIIEISETKTKNIGLKYGLNGFETGSSSLHTFSSSLNSFSGDTQALSLTQLAGYGYSPQILQSALSLGVTINLLKENKALEVISEPSILCINNKESSIYVGETRSIPTGTTVGTTTTTNFGREDIGLRLSIKPRLSSDGKVTLLINTIIEDVKLSSVNHEIPDTNKKEVLTTAIVNNGENVIIGGLIKNKLETTEQKVPFFGDIPLFGSLFKSDYDYEDKINLVIIVTPYIIPKSKNLTDITEHLAQLKLVEDSYTQKLKKILEEKKSLDSKEHYGYQ